MNQFRRHGNDKHRDSGTRSFVRGSLISGTPETEFPLNENCEIGAEGIELKCIEPFKLWKIKFDGTLLMNGKGMEKICFHFKKLMS